MSSVRCSDCLNYPVWHRQPGSDMCISVASERSLESRPCEPRLRPRAGRVAGSRRAARPRVHASQSTSQEGQFLGKLVVWILVIFGALLVVTEILSASF